MSWLSDTLGSVAGSVLGSAVQNHYNSANAAQANAWNVENYKHRYQWAVDDMRSAGLNPHIPNPTSERPPMVSYTQYTPLPHSHPNNPLSACHQKLPDCTE